MQTLELEDEGLVVRYGDLRFRIINETMGFNGDHLAVYDALLIESSDTYFVGSIITMLRSSMNTQIYLKPVFLLKGTANRDPFINALVDGMLFAAEQVKIIAPQVQRIISRINDLNFSTAISYEAQVISKVAHYMYTRELTRIDPIPYNYSGIGYTFPPISVNYKFREEAQVLNVIAVAEEEGIFNTTFHDRIYLCTNCHTGFMSFREVCPKCASSNSESQDIIHHFRCGYVAPLSDYSNAIDDQLNCPKCNKQLRHIGVDYDKPSVLHSCRNCGHKYQDFVVKAKCVTCSFDNEVDQLVYHEVKSLEITKKGELVATHGYVSTSKDLEEIIGTVKMDVFRTMLRYEIERLKQTEGHSNIAGVFISNAGEFYSKIGSSMEQALLKDLVEVVRGNIRTSDMITFKDSSTLLLSMNDIPQKVGENIMEEIVQLILKLLNTNFPNLNIQIKYAVKQVHAKLNHELQIQQLLQQVYTDVQS